MVTKEASPVPEVVYGTLPDGETLKRTGKEAAAWLADMLAQPRLTHVEEMLAQSKAHLEAGEYVEALEYAEAARWFMGEYMHPVARAVAASGIDPVKVLEERDSRWVTPHNNDFIPPFEPARSPTDDNLERWQRIAKMPPAKQEAATQRLAAKELKARAEYDKEVERNVNHMGAGALLNLFRWAEYMALMDRQIAEAQASQSESQSA